jgi:hypothetical protein
MKWLKTMSKGIVLYWTSKGNRNKGRTLIPKVNFNILVNAEMYDYKAWQGWRTGRQQTNSGRGQNIPLQGKYNSSSSQFPHRGPWQPRRKTILLCSPRATSTLPSSERKVIAYSKLQVPVNAHSWTWMKNMIALASKILNEAVWPTRQRLSCWTSSETSEVSVSRWNFTEDSASHWNFPEVSASHWNFTRLTGTSVKFHCHRNCRPIR